jgi:hypothetical protein
MTQYYAIQFAKSCFFCFFCVFVHVNIGILWYVFLCIGTCKYWYSMICFFVYSYKICVDDILPSEALKHNYGKAIQLFKCCLLKRGRRNRMVVGFTIICEISAYNHYIKNNINIFIKHIIFCCFPNIWKNKIMLLLKKAVIMFFLFFLCIRTCKYWYSMICFFVYWYM